MAGGHSVFNLVFNTKLIFNNNLYYYYKLIYNLYLNYIYLCSLEQVEPPGTGLLFSLQTVDSFFLWCWGFELEFQICWASIVLSHTPNSENVVFNVNRLIVKCVLFTSTS